MITCQAVLASLCISCLLAAGHAECFIAVDTVVQSMRKTQPGAGSPRPVANVYMHIMPALKEAKGLFWLCSIGSCTFQLHLHPAKHYLTCTSTAIPPVRVPGCSAQPTVARLTPPGGLPHSFVGRPLPMAADGSHGTQVRALSRCSRLSVPLALPLCRLWGLHSAWELAIMLSWLSHAAILIPAMNVLGFHN